jgi:hypothetical protein
LTHWTRRLRRLRRVHFAISLTKVTDRTPPGVAVTRRHSLHSLLTVNRAKGQSQKARRCHIHRRADSHWLDNNSKCTYIGTIAPNLVERPRWPLGSSQRSCTLLSTRRVTNNIPCVSWPERVPLTLNASPTVGAAGSMIVL